jgi:type II secretory pathway pseudopilin PulG
MIGPSRQSGLTVIEILVSVAIGAVLIVSLGGAVGQALEVRNQAQARAELLQDANFAMDRMVQAVRGTRRLMLPLADNPNTAWREHVREQTVPASAPETDSTLATAVLAVTLPASADLDADGWADPNNDRDFQDLNGDSVRNPGEWERIDEDVGQDNTEDGEAGIIGIDDNGDGLVDVSAEGHANHDNDEDDGHTDDSVNGLDDDGDGSVDEDIHDDMNMDGESGIRGVDDDLDGDIDEEGHRDDDEDGSDDEDWFDPLVFRLQGTDLIERRPVPYDANGDSVIDGLDFVESVIAENVTLFRVERIPAPPGGSVTVDLTLELTDANANRITLHSVARVGGPQ